MQIATLGRVLIALVAAAGGASTLASAQELPSADISAVAERRPAEADGSGSLADLDALVATLADDEQKAMPARGDDASVARAVDRSVPRPLSELIGSVQTTARRTVENVQRIPVAVTVFSKDELIERNVRRLRDLSGLVPNLSIDNALGTANGGRVTVRGVSEGDPLPTRDQAVGVYVNGVYRPRAEGLLSVLHDVERVEVVRGPQGTLFGKNTIGGAINIVTSRPVFTNEASAEVRVGNDRRLDTRAVVNIPLVAEVAAARFSVATNYDQGYQRNVTLGEDLGTDRFLGARGQLLLAPMDNLEIQLGVDYAREDRRPQGTKCKVVTAPSPIVQGVQLASGVDLQAPCVEDQMRSEFKSASDLTFAEDDLRSTLYTAQVMWDINPALSLRSTSSMRVQDNDIRQDFDATARNIAQAVVDAGGSEQRAYSQEIQLRGFGFGDRLSYVLGLYAGNENIDQQMFGGIFSQLPGAVGMAIPSVDSRLDVDNRSYAAYGQLDYLLTDALTVTAGLRRTVERKRVRKEDIAFEPFVAMTPVWPVPLPAGTLLFAPFERSERFDDFSPSLSLSYQPYEGLLTYVSYATGFRSGGFNGRVDGLNNDRGVLDPEDLTNYEVGFKSTLLGERLRLNGSAFYSIYKDIQATIITAGTGGAPTTIVRNAARSKLRGAELEIVALPTRQLRLEATLSAFRNRLSDFSAQEATGADISGLSDAASFGQPDYIMMLAATYQDVQVGDLGFLSARLQWVQRGPQSNTATDLEAVRTGKFGLLSARVAFELLDGSTEIALFGTNLLDRRYINNGTDVSRSVGVVNLFQGPPRRYGVELRRSF